MFTECVFVLSHGSERRVISGCDNETVWLSPCNSVCEWGEWGEGGGGIGGGRWGVGGWSGPLLSAAIRAHENMNCEVLCMANTNRSQIPDNSLPPSLPPPTCLPHTQIMSILSWVKMFLSCFGAHSLSSSSWWRSLTMLAFLDMEKFCNSHNRHIISQTQSQRSKVKGRSRKVTVGGCGQRTDAAEALAPSCWGTRLQRARWSTEEQQLHIFGHDPWETKECSVDGKIEERIFH